MELGPVHGCSPFLGVLRPPHCLCPLLTKATFPVGQLLEKGATSCLHSARSSEQVRGSEGHPRGRQGWAGPGAPKLEAREAMVALVLAPLPCNEPRPWRGQP